MAKTKTNWLTRMKDPAGKTIRSLEEKSAAEHAKKTAQTDFGSSGGLLASYFGGIAPKLRSKPRVYEVLKILRYAVSYWIACFLFR